MMLKIIIDTYYKAKTFINRSVPITQVLPSEITSKLLTMKEDITDLNEFKKIEDFLSKHFEGLEKKYNS
jgi:V/A-type H+-transporting ATPase subunit A